MPLQFTKPERLSLKGHPDFSEKWVQNRICDDPSILGVGDVEVVMAEKIQPKAGLRCVCRYIAANLSRPAEEDRDHRRRNPLHSRGRAAVEEDACHKRTDSQKQREADIPSRHPPLPHLPNTHLPPLRSSIKYRRLMRANRGDAAE